MRKITFPPKKLHDLGKVGAHNFLSLARSAKDSNLALVLGSGTSASAGIPTWYDLLKRLSLTFFSHWELKVQSNTATYDRPPKNMSIAYVADEGEKWPGLAMEYMFPGSSKYINESSASFVDGDPLVIAQLIKNCIRDIDWRYLLYHSLYLDYTDKTVDDIKSILLEKLSNLCSKTNNIKAIINYNYDNTFEIHLRRMGIKCRAYWNSEFSEKKGRLPIFYPHGYLPFPGGPIARTVIAESDYHGEYSEPHSWSNLVQLREFTRSTCIFIGLSMTDPNLRRLLRSSMSVSNLSHYAFLPMDSNPTQQQKMHYSLFDSDLLKLNVRVIRFVNKINGDEPYNKLNELVDVLADAIINEKDIWK